MERVSRDLKNTVGLCHTLRAFRPVIAFDIDGGELHVNSNWAPLL